MDSPEFTYGLIGIERRAFDCFGFACPHPDLQGYGFFLG